MRVVGWYSIGKVASVLMKGKLMDGSALHESVSSKAKTFTGHDYTSFGIEYPREASYLPDGSEPLAYWKGGFWHPGNEDSVAALALIGEESHDDYSPVAYIDLRWPTSDRRVYSATKEFMCLADAKETFNKMLTDIEEMTPSKLVRKYRLNVR